MNEIKDHRLPPMFHCYSIIKSTTLWLNEALCPFKHLVWEAIDNLASYATDLNLSPFIWDDDDDDNMIVRESDKKKHFNSAFIWCVC